MPSIEYPVEWIHLLALASFLTWTLVSLVAHLVTPLRWKGYSLLGLREQRQWCNRIACGLHAALVVCCQVWHLRDPALSADPLHAVCPSHFLWGSVMYGYLAYDTVWTVVFPPAAGQGAFLVHHLIGILACVMGLYYNKMALFGMAIQVFMEGTTPLLHVLGCMKLAGATSGRVYRVLGLVFIAQFFAFRVVMANTYAATLVRETLALARPPWWAWTGVAVFAVLGVLNVYWFGKLLRMAFGSSKQQRPVAASRAKGVVAPAAEPGKSVQHSSAAPPPEIKAVRQSRKTGKRTIDGVLPLLKGAAAFNVVEGTCDKSTAASDAVYSITAVAVTVERKEL